MFEQEYQLLSKDAYKGWGGAKYARRLAGWKRSVNWLMDQKKIPPPATVLELGCGNGMASYILAQRGYDVSGVDISETAIKWANHRFRLENLEGAFIIGNVCDMNFYADGQFDLVIDGNCLHCIFGDARQSFLKEAYRVTRAGGYFLLSSMCGPPRSKRAIQAFDPVRRCLTKNGQAYRYLASNRMLTREVNHSGFRILSKNVNHNNWWNHLTILTQKPVSD